MKKWNGIDYKKNYEYRQLKVKSNNSIINLAYQWATISLPQSTGEEILWLSEWFENTIPNSQYQYQYTSQWICIIDKV